MTVLLDDHLLRDWMGRRDEDLLRAIADAPLATTNLWYARLCRSAARSTVAGALLSSWSREERAALLAGLVALPGEVTTIPMRQLSWEMGRLAAEHHGLSLLGAEAVAAARALDARVLVSSRDDGPGIRACCLTLGVPYRALPR